MENQTTGTVKWFNTTKGYGFILTEDGKEVFVHYTDILSEGFRNLSEGDRVSFTLSDTGKGLRALNVVKAESESE